MAHKRVVVTVDDFDGETPAESVRFGLDGKVYEVDLSPENMATFRETLAAYIEVGRRVPASRKKRS